MNNWEKKRKRIMNLQKRKMIEKVQDLSRLINLINKSIMSLLFIIIKKTN